MAKFEFDPDLFPAGEDEGRAQNPDQEMTELAGGSILEFLRNHFPTLRFTGEEAERAYHEKNPRDLYRAIFTPGFGGSWMRECSATIGKRILISRRKHRDGVIKFSLKEL